MVTVPEYEAMLLLKFPVSVELGKQPWLEPDRPPRTLGLRGDKLEASLAEPEGLHEVVSARAPVHICPLHGQ